MNVLLEKWKYVRSAIKILNYIFPPLYDKTKSAKKYVEITTTILTEHGTIISKQNR